MVKIGTLRSTAQECIRILCCTAVLVLMVVELYLLLGCPTVAEQAPSREGGPERGIFENKGIYVMHNYLTIYFMNSTLHGGAGGRCKGAERIIKGATKGAKEAEEQKEPRMLRRNNAISGVSLK